MPTLQGQDVSSSEDFLDTESLEESVTVTPPTLPHDDGSSCIFPSTREEILAGSVESTYALTLPEQDYLDNSLESITASPHMVPHNSIDVSSSTLPSGYVMLPIDVADSASALSLQEPDVSYSEELLNTTPLEESIAVTPLIVPHNPTAGSPPSASHVGSKIWFRQPPDTNQVYFVRMDCSRSFCIYPCLGGPFHSLDEAEGAINNRVNQLRCLAMSQEQDRFPLDQIEHAIGEEYCLVQALLDQYNDEHSLSEDLKHEVESLVRYEWIYENERWFYHFNFTTKTKKADDVHYSNGNMFFAEVSHMQGDDTYEVNYCSTIDSDDNGHCYGCINNGSPDMRHPKDTDAYTGGHLNGYLPFGDDDFSGSDDDEEAEENRLRIMFKGLDDPCVLERIYRLATDPV